MATAEEQAVIDAACKWIAWMKKERGEAFNAGFNPSPLFLALDDALEALSASRDPRVEVIQKWHLGVFGDFVEPKYAQYLLRSLDEVRDDT